MFFTPFSQKCSPEADAAVFNIREAQDEHDIIVMSFLLSLGHWEAEFPHALLDPGVPSWARP